MSSAPGRSVEYVLTKPVSEYMDRDLLLLGRQTSTREAARVLRHYERDDIIVVDSENHPIGIVTDEDIISKVSDVSVNAEATRINDIMSSPVITIEEGSSLQTALHRMRDHKIRKLPVINKKKMVIGIILQTSIANAIRNATAVQPRLLSPPVKAILGNLGFVLQFAGVLLLVPAIVATILNDTVTATGIFITTVLLLVTGFFLNSYGEKAALNLQQASVLVFASLFILILFGTIPYFYVMTPSDGGAGEIFASSFFSSAAGFTTGGISLFEKPEELPQSFTFYRSFTQLVGGMSFIYLVITAFYPESKLQAMRGFISGKTLHMKELFGTITVIFALYITIVAVLLYLFGENNILDNFSLAMSTLATGGFVPTSTILVDLVWQEYLVLYAAMILGALPFTFHYGFVRKRFLSPKLGREVLVYFAILGAGAVLLILTSGLDPLDGVFYAVSASTTAGLQITSLESLNVYAHGILMTLMFVGGCGFSTAGGIKIFRILQLRHALAALRGGAHLEKAKRNKKEIATTIIIVSAFPLIAVVTAFHLADITDSTFENAFFEAAGVITTGGLFADVITTDIDSATLISLGFLMIFGRLEIIAIVYIFVPRLAT